MKRTLILVFLSLVWIVGPAQELDSLKAIMGVEESESESENKVENEEEVNVNIGDKEMIKVVENDDSGYVKVGSNKLLEVYDHPDSTRIRVGNKEITIVENDNKADIRISKVHEKTRRYSEKFRGHWTGFEWGMNNFLDNDFTLSRENESNYMDLNTSRSWSINLNFAQFSLGFGTSHFGAVTGLGLEFNNYFFDNSNTIAEINDSVVGIPIESINLSKSKLTTTFLRIPILFEGQFPHTYRGRRVFISAGVITGIKLGSHTKYVYDDDGKDKNKDKDDFNINPFRFGVTARLGYGCLALFSDYYFTPMFVREKGPELYPFNVGMSLTF